ncbi:hypothetical protein [Colwellia sp. MB3u-4]|uniref:hypothetical protein n=1 Tax=Colwellia sp. MB3u-4 TaxID=2759822 RepID=UPI001C710F91|nr:hypothetical protein [Colwellia sp. MB3u-4]
MNINNNTYQEIKDDLEEASFLINKSGEEKKVHKLIMSALIKLAKHEDVSQEKPASEANEINKVARRLKLWTNRPDQMNTKILSAYLKLASKEGKVTEEQLKQEVSEESSFDSNFTQMRIIADRNHGKVFSIDNGEVTIWEPIKQYVDTFKTNSGL